MSDASNNTEEEPPFSPNAFMRARRPYLFSDSSEVAAPNLTREILSYHLETLTKLKEEAWFEQFAKRLAHKFISPNIRPQTGPSGGGDGKTDAETYPVASDIAAAWFVGDPSEGANRIAFAFSAKEAWRQKVQADVAEIVKTRRDYKRIYFISNQLIPARQSAEVQDALEEKHGIPVTILDRTWLLDRVFDDSSVDIVIETFGAMGSTSKVIKVLGPQDYKRQLELDEIESRIALGGEYPGSPYTMVDEA